MPVVVTGLSGDVSAISVGAEFSCAINAGAVKCWGMGFLGQLGNGGSKDSPVPVAVSGLGRGVTALASDLEQTCAVVETSVRCWGDQIPDLISEKKKQKTSRVPKTVPGLKGITQIAVNAHHACALSSDGTVRCWGENMSGELGSGNDHNSPVPIPVHGLPANVLSVAVGAHHSCALIGGKPYCWGNACYGQLGDSEEGCSTFNPKKGQLAPVAVKF